MNVNNNAGEHVKLGKFGGDRKRLRNESLERAAFISSWSRLLQAVRGEYSTRYEDVVLLGRI